MRRRRTKKLLRNGGHILRAVLLAITVLAVATVLAWTWQKERIDEWDSGAFAAFQKRFTSGFEEAMGLLSAGKIDEGRRALEELRALMGDVKGQDRLAVINAAAIESLVNVYDRLGEPEKALMHSEELIKLNPNHYRFWLTYAFQLEKNELRKEAIDALFRAYRIAPHSLKAASALSEVLFHESRRQEAREVLRGYLDANRGGMVALSVERKGKTPESTETTLASVAFTGTRQAFAFPVEAAGGASFTFRLHQVMDLNVEITGLSVVTPKGRRSAGLDAIDFRATDMARTGRTAFAITGENPSVSFALPEELGRMDIKAIEIEAVFTPSFPERLAFLLRGA
jgi:tetratricopeptide (TPR) repeat protein